MTLTIDLATEVDIDWLDKTDHHIMRGLITRKVQSAEILIAKDKGEPIALLRWNNFWDMIPFMNLLWVVEERRGQGVGSQIVAHWEHLAKAKGSDMVMTSTQADESAQHFYRKIGYTDSGALFLPTQAAEIILIKYLTS